MNKNFTTNHFIQYAYNETALNETVFVQKHIDANPLAAEEYKGIVKVLAVLDRISLEPSERSMDRIFRHLYCEEEVRLLS